MHIFQSNSDLKKFYIVFFSMSYCIFTLLVKHDIRDLECIQGFYSDQGSVKPKVTKLRNCYKCLNNLNHLFLYLWSSYLFSIQGNLLMLFIMGFALHLCCASNILCPNNLSQLAQLFMYYASFCSWLVEELGKKLWNCQSNIRCFLLT